MDGKGCVQRKRESEWSKDGIKNSEGTGVDVELVFTDDKEHIVLATNKGDNITYTGKLVTRCGYIMPYKLDDGNIENVVKKPKPAK